MRKKPGPKPKPISELTSPIYIERRLKAERAERTRLLNLSTFRPCRIAAKLRVTRTSRDWARGTATWRKLNAGLMVKHLPLFGPLPAAESEHIRPDLTAWAGTTLIQSDERCYA